MIDPSIHLFLVMIHIGFYVGIQRESSSIGCAQLQVLEKIFDPYIMCQCTFSMDLVIYHIHKRPIYMNKSLLHTNSTFMIMPLNMYIFNELKVQHICCLIQTSMFNPTSWTKSQDKESSNKKIQESKHKGKRCSLQKQGQDQIEQHDLIKP